MRVVSLYWLINDSVKQLKEVSLDSHSSQRRSICEEDNVVLLFIVKKEIMWASTGKKTALLCDILENRLLILS
jgi:hypothetical protein